MCFHLLVLHPFRKQVKRWRFFFFFKILSLLSILKLKCVVSSCFRRWGGHHGSNGVKVGGCTSHAARGEAAWAGKHCWGNVYTVLENSTTPCQPDPICLWLTTNGEVQNHLQFFQKTQLFFALNMILNTKLMKWVWFELLCVQEENQVFYNPVFG